MFTETATAENQTSPEEDISCSGDFCFCEYIILPGLECHVCGADED